MGGGNWRNTYEPAACLVGWEAEMKKVDKKYSIAALLPQINPVVEATKAREEAAKRKAEQLRNVNLVKKVVLTLLLSFPAMQGKSIGP